MSTLIKTKSTTLTSAAAPARLRTYLPATHGRSSPLGATISPVGVNFSIFSRTASVVELLLFDREDDDRPARVVRFDPALNRTYYYWHVFVPEVRAGAAVWLSDTRAI